MMIHHYYGRRKGDVFRLFLLTVIFLCSSVYKKWRRNLFDKPMLNEHKLLLVETTTSSSSTPLMIREEFSTLKQQQQPEAALCIGYRRTSCTWQKGTIRLPWFDLSCDEYIPRKSSGYCEYLYSNGTSFRMFYQSCRKVTRSATCRMAADFYHYKQQAHNHVLDPPMKVSSSSSSSSSSQQHQQSKGIVMSVYPGLILSVYSILHLLRHDHGCTLPIELWSIPGELDVDPKASADRQQQQKQEAVLLQHILQQLPNITHRILPTTKDAKDISGFMIKPYSIVYSHFDQVLWLDADNVPVRDPSYLFDTPQYQSTGTLFYKDYWQPKQSIFDLDEESLVWELLGVPPTQDFEMESGQLLLDKRQDLTVRALSIVMYLATTFDSRWIGPLRLLWGDKDLFRMAWYMAHASSKNEKNGATSFSSPAFSYVKTPPSPLGFTVSPTNKETYQKMKFTSCGVTMAQYDPYGKPLFLHRNEFKLRLDRPETRQAIWDGIYEFTGTNATEEYRIGSTKDKERGVSCYHPDHAMEPFFKERNVSQIYPEIVAAEQRLLRYAENGIDIVSTKT